MLFIFSRQYFKELMQDYNKDLNYANLFKEKIIFNFVRIIKK